MHDFYVDQIDIYICNSDDLAKKPFAFGLNHGEARLLFIHRGACTRRRQH